MKLLFLGLRLEKYKIEIFFINFIILLYIFRTVMPILKYPFVLLYGVFFLYALITRKDKIKDRLKVFIYNYAIIILLALILCIAFLFSYKINLLVFKDLINAILLLSFFFTLTILIDSEKELKFLISNLIKNIILFAILFLFHDLLKLFNINSISYTYSSKIDYNFALLPVFFGMVGIFYLLAKTKSVSNKIFYNFLLIGFFLNILLSSSRRGVIVLIVIVVTLLFAQFFLLFKKGNYIKKIALNSRFFLISIVIIFFASYVFTFHTSYRFKNTCLELFSSKNIFFVKKQVTSKLYRYVSIVNNTYNYSDFYEMMWTRKFEPIYPASGWGYENCKRVFPLTGENVAIVPANAIGCLMDSSCYDPPDLRKIRYDSYSLIDKIEVKKNEKYKASVYCYVSNDFDGRVRFLLGWVALDNKVVSHNPIDFYDLKNKGSWQKLNIEFDCNDGVVPIYISILKNAEKDFSKMNGYVIFAYPQYDRINADTILSYTNFEDNQKTEIIDFTQNENLQNFNSVINTKTEIKGNGIKNDIEFYRSFNDFKDIKYDRASLFFIPQQFLKLEILSIMAQDPIRNWAAKFISEDTIYHGYKSDLYTDTISGRFSGPRIARWQFALQIFTKEYTLPQKLFGNGFNYLNWYGNYFYKDKTRSDWPHNPFLSVLLYSGIIGLGLYLFVLYRAFVIYIMYIKDYYILFIFFIITFFFSLFSANSPFTPSVMGFFIMLPFLIHFVHKKFKPELNGQNAN